jgi:hypothetical protein
LCFAEADASCSHFLRTISLCAWWLTDQQLLTLSLSDESPGPLFDGYIYRFILGSTVRACDHRHLTAFVVLIAVSNP